MLAVFLMLVALGYSEAQEKKAYKVSCIGFYNLENLFDTLPGPNDVEFTPDGPNKWNSERYYHKLNNMAEVIAQIGDEMFPGGPAVLGVSEIENRLVQDDLGRVHVNPPRSTRTSARGREALRDRGCAWRQRGARPTRRREPAI